MGDNSSRLLEIGKEFRECSIVKNSGGYILGKNEYKEGNPDTISDGDDRGRDPLDSTSASSSIGTNTDIGLRITQLSRNNCLYSKSKPYGEGNC